MSNIIKHFKLVCTHKKYVFLNCKKAGLFWAGIKHDLSKFSPIEFLESVKYYDGTKSPIDVCKQKHGYSKAWLHHKGGGGIRTIMNIGRITLTKVGNH